MLMAMLLSAVGWSLCARVAGLSIYSMKLDQSVVAGRIVELLIYRWNKQDYKDLKLSAYDRENGRSMRSEAAMPLEVW